MKEPQIAVSQSLLQLIAEIDEFKGQWRSLKTLSPERLQELRKVATIESVGSSTRIEGAKLTDLQVETLLSNLSISSFETRDELVNLWPTNLLGDNPFPLETSGSIGDSGDL